MDIRRARQIASSPVMANVNYNGEKIYIENVNDNGTCLIHSLNNPSKKQDVSVNQLMEK